jgi:ABC-type antimicrobial peptide transport system permease subunit
MLYFYESFVLVIASSTLGVLIGLIIGYTMTLQQTLLLGQKFDFFFPWKQYVLILGLSLLCALFSTLTPTSLLLKKPIASIFKSV